MFFSFVSIFLLVSLSLSMFISYPIGSMKREKDKDNKISTCMIVLVSHWVESHSSLWFPRISNLWHTMSQRTKTDHTINVWSFVPILPTSRRLPSVTFRSLSLSLSQKQKSRSYRESLNGHHFSCGHIGPLPASNTNRSC